MNVVNIKNVVFKVPEHWNELSEKQLVWLLEHMEHLIKPSYDFRLRMMLKLLDIPKWRVRTIKNLLNAPVAQIAYMSRLVDWAFPIENVNLTKNVFKTKRVLFRKLIGPADSLKNLTLEEFSFADFHFRQYMTTQNESELNKLCAVLWRVQGKKLRVNDVGFRNDDRIIFNSYAINKNALRFKMTSKIFKLYVLMFFWGCRNTFVSNYANVFGGGNDTKSEGMNLGWVNVMFELSGNKFGTLEETSKQGLTTILLFLENSLINQKTKKHE